MKTQQNKIKIDSKYHYPKKEDRISQTACPPVFFEHSEASREQITLDTVKSLDEFIIADLDNIRDGSTLSRLILHVQTLPDGATLIRAIICNVGDGPIYSYQYSARAWLQKWKRTLLTTSDHLSEGKRHMATAEDYHLEEWDRHAVGLNIGRSMGDRNHKKDPAFTSIPHIRQLEIKITNGDRVSFVLASDGIDYLIGSDVLGCAIDHFDSGLFEPKDLIKKALELGSRDDISVTKTDIVPPLEEKDFFAIFGIDDGHNGPNTAIACSQMFSCILDFMSKIYARLLQKEGLELNKVSKKQLAEVLSKHKTFLDRANRDLHSALREFRKTQKSKQISLKELLQADQTLASYFLEEKPVFREKKPPKEIKLPQKTEKKPKKFSQPEENKHSLRLTSIDDFAEDLKRLEKKLNEKDRLELLKSQQILDTIIDSDWIENDLTILYIKLHASFGKPELHELFAHQMDLLYQKHPLKSLRYESLTPQLKWFFNTFIWTLSRKEKNLAQDSFEALMKIGNPLTGNIFSWIAIQNKTWTIITSQYINAMSPETLALVIQSSAILWLGDNFKLIMERLKKPELILQALREFEINFPVEIDLTEKSQIFLIAQSSDENFEIFFDVLKRVLTPKQLLDLILKNEIIKQIAESPTKDEKISSKKTTCVANFLVEAFFKDPHNKKINVIKQSFISQGFSANLLQAAALITLCDDKHCFQDSDFIELKFPALLTKRVKESKNFNANDFQSKLELLGTHITQFFSNTGLNFKFKKSTLLSAGIVSLLAYTKSNDPQTNIILELAAAMAYQLLNGSKNKIPAIPHLHRLSVEDTQKKLIDYLVYTTAKNWQTTECIQLFIKFGWVEQNKIDSDTSLLDKVNLTQRGVFAPKSWLGSHGVFFRSNWGQWQNALKSPSEFKDQLNRTSFSNGGTF